MAKRRGRPPGTSGRAAVLSSSQVRHAFRVARGRGRHAARAEAALTGALTLDVTELLRRGVLAPGSRRRGVISWVGPKNETLASVSYEADMFDASRAWLRLRFSTPLPEGARRQVDQRVSLATTRPGFGGERWWFVDDDRRVRRLSLPSGGDTFRSRLAHGLVTRSTRHVRESVVE